MRLFLVVLALVGVSYDAAATTLSDLNCARGQIPKFIGAKWVCKVDNLGRRLVDANRKVVGPVLDVSRSGASFILRVTDRQGSKRSVRLQATKYWFGAHWEIYASPYFAAPDCQGDAWMDFRAVYEDSRFNSLGELGMTAPSVHNNSVIDLYLPVTNAQPQTVSVMSNWTPNTQSSPMTWSCQNLQSAAQLNGVALDLAVPNILQGFTLPFDVVE